MVAHRHRVSGDAACAMVALALVALAPVATPLPRASPPLRRGTAERVSFALTFTTVTRNGDHNVGVASSQTLATTFNATGVSFQQITHPSGPTAVWSSLVTTGHQGAYTEQGNISFGTAGDQLRFTSAGSGMAHSLGPLSYGGIGYRIVGGSGAFSGASGFMVDTFVAGNTTDAFEINAWGILWLAVPHWQPESAPANSRLAGPAKGPQPIDSKQAVAAAAVGVESAAAKEPARRVRFAVEFSCIPVAGVNHATAKPQLLRTSVAESGLPRFAVQPTAETGTEMRWTSQAVAYPNGTFGNTGNITLVDAATGALYAAVQFRNDGLGHSGNGPGKGDSYGGIAYRVTGGAGLWANVVAGSFVDMFIGTANQTEFPILVWGSLWLGTEPLPAPSSLPSSPLGGRATGNGL